MKKHFLNELKPDTPAYVLAHAKWRASRGKRPVATLGEISNPRKALAVALKADQEGISERTRTAGSIAGCYVRMNGKIFPYGCIRVFALSVVQDTDDEDAGGKIWSEKLLPYGTGEYYARIESDEMVTVCRKGDGSIVESIMQKDLYRCDIWTVVVAKNGYIFATGAPGMKFSRSTVSDRDIKMLTDVQNFRKPIYLDNSPFTRVSPKLAGQELIKVDIGDSAEVFTPDGKRVKSMTHFPLSYRRWTGKEFNCRQGPIDDIEDDRDDYI